MIGSSLGQAKTNIDPLGQTNQPKTYTDPSNAYGSPTGLIGSSGFNNWQKTYTNSVDSGNNPSGSITRDSATYLQPLLAQQLQYEGNLEPQRERAINDQIQALNPAGIQANINQFGNGAQEAAGNSARNLSLINGSQGIGSGVTSGQAANLFQNANNQTNQYANQVNSPQARAQQLSQMLQAVMGGMTPNSLAQELSLAGPNANTAAFNNQVDQQKGALTNSIIGSLTGALSGGLEGGLPNILSGLGKSSGGGNFDQYAPDQEDVF